MSGLLVKNPRERTPTLADLRRQLEALDLGGLPLIHPASRAKLDSLHLGPRTKRATGPHSIAELAAEEETGPRYQFETPLGGTPISQLARAVDTVLDRSVVIERFDATEDADRALEHARLLGRVQSPFVQRALSLDRQTRTAVFEAPAGASLADATPTLPPVEAVRLLKRLARAAAAIHELGGSHGTIGPRTLVLDDALVPTMLIAGLGAPGATTPADDVAAIVALIAGLVGSAGGFAALAAALCNAVGAILPAFTLPHDGESLYVAADAVDIAVLGALGAR
jgi:hypothetical protein